MPPRNVGQIVGGRSKPIPGYFWVPPTDGAIYKIEVETDSETLDITEDIIDGEYTDGITETIGDFNFTIDNSSQKYSDKISIYDSLKIYMNYGSEASVLKFTGLIERPALTENKINLIGKGGALRTVGKNVTYSAEDTSRSEVLIAIVEKYFSGVITTTNVETDDTEITVNYEDKPFWEIVQELCASGGRDAYIDKDFDLHYFESGSRANDTDAAVHDYNIISTGDFSPDLQGVVNRVIVYGRKEGDVVILASAEDTTAQSDLDGDIKELIIQANNLTTVQQCQDRADLELAENKTPPIVGEVESLILPTLSPGEKVRISDPLNGIDPDYYTIRKYTHKFSNSEPPKTILTIQKERSSIPTILKKRVKFETEISESNNPLEMTHSLLFDFSLADIGTHSNTEVDLVSGGILQLTEGSSSGTWISPVNNINLDVTAGEIRISGDSLGPDLKVFLSHDGGQTETRVGFNNVVGDGTVAVDDGKQLRMRLEINNADIKIRRISWLYKTS